MLVQLLNGRSAGGAFPASANDAYVVAKDWISASLRATDSRGIVASGAAFMLADDVRALVVSPQATPAIKRSSGAMPSKKLSLPPKSAGQITSRVRFASPPPVADSAIHNAPPRERRAETRTCYKCGTVGHIIKNCPQFALAAIGDEEDDESALYEAALYDLGLDSACLMTRCATEINEKVLFTPN